VAPVRRRVRAYIGWFCFVVIAYYAAAHLGYALKFAGPVASIVWLPAGIGIAALYLLGPQFWPAVVVGDLLVNNYSTLPIGSAIGQSFGNLLEVLTAALLMRRFASRNQLLGSIAGFGGLLVALLAGTLENGTCQGDDVLGIGHGDDGRSVVARPSVLRGLDPSTFVDDTFGLPTVTAILSEREAEPVLIWPVLSATAKSAIVLSSVSPERCDMMLLYEFFFARFTALIVSVSDPI